MASHAHPALQLTRKQAAFLVAAWLLIVVKCLLVSWAVQRWHLPFAAGWVIYPTLAFAVLATAVWVLHREPEE